MKFAPIDQIKVEDRQRKKIDSKKLAELERSIAEKGLFHPIVLRSLGPNNYKLVAGERRLTAIGQLHKAVVFFNCDGDVVPTGLAPFIEITDLTEIGYREAELEENILREDLSWQDRVSAISELHELRRAVNPAQTKKDTARELANAKGLPASRRDKRPLKQVEQAVHRAEIIAPFLDDPDVQRARSDHEAFKIVSRKIEAEFQAELGIPATSAHTLIEGYLHIEMEKMSRGQFACVIADPPYGIGADKFGDAAAMKHQYADDSATAYSLSQDIISHGFNVCALQGYLFLFCDIDHFLALRSFARDIGWRPFRTPIVWEKSAQRGHVPEQTGLRRSYELILCASKGNKKMSRIEADVIHVAPEIDPLHAAQKPPKLYRRLLQLVCIHGDAVIDPCCGAGTIFAAAHELGLRATGIELDEAQCLNSKATLSKLYE